MAYWLRPFIIFCFCDNDLTEITIMVLGFCVIKKHIYHFNVWLLSIRLNNSASGVNWFIHANKQCALFI